MPAYEPTPNVYETDKSDKFRIVRNNNNTPTSIASIRNDMIRTLYTVDDEVGRLIDYLEASGEMSNTLFIFTSDNGYAWAEHGLRGKFTPYPVSVDVPWTGWSGGRPTPSSGCGSRCVVRTRGIGSSGCSVSPGPRLTRTQSARRPRRATCGCG